MVGGYKAFNLQGKEIEPMINTIEVKKEVIEAPKEKAGCSSIVYSKISNRIPQNDLRPSSPNGHCLFRALLAAVEEKIGQAFTLNDMNKIKKNCSYGNHISIIILIMHIPVKLMEIKISLGVKG